MSFFKQGAAVCAFATLAMIGADAAAATIRVTCESRPGRAKISVDGNNLARGKYSTVVESGGNMARSPLERSDGDEIEVDYDSHQGEGVTISPNFIVNRSVTGKIIDVNGNTVISDTSSCRVRRH